jgi:hypothetical protein
LPIAYDVRISHKILRMQRLDVKPPFQRGHHKFIIKR